MKRAVLVVLLAACSANDGGDYPTRPGGGGPVVMGGGGGDAGTGDGGTAGDGGVQVSARVCVITDLRKLTTCSATGAAGLRVTLGNAPALTVTSDDGHFTLTAPSSTDLIWHVSATQADRIVTSAMRFGTDNLIPVISTQTYTTLRALFGAGLPVDQQGSVVVRVVHGVAPVADVAATTNLDQNNAVLYDGDPALKDDWGTIRTGVAGVVWFPGVSLSPSSGTVTLTAQGNPTPVTVPVTVENDTITFATKDIP